MEWKAFFATFGGWTLGAMNWMIVALVMPLLMKEWKLDLASVGLIGGADLIGAFVSSFIWGPVADRLGRVKGLCATILGYSILTALCGVAQNYTQMFVLRIACGVFLGGEWAMGATLLNEYWPSRRRARAMSAAQSGWPVGFGLASLLFALIVPAFGWRALFFVGIFPVLLVLYIMKYVPEPEVWVKFDGERHGIKSSIRAGQEVTVKQKERLEFPLKMLFRGDLIRRTLTCTLIMICVSLAFRGAGTWLPTYLATTKGLSVAHTGIYMFWLNAGAFVGYYVFGWVGDKRGRRLALGLGFAGSAIVVLIYVNLNSPAAFFWCGPILGFVYNGFYGQFGVVFTELFPVFCRATAANFAFNVGRGLGFFGPVLIGAFAKQYGLGAGIGATSALYMMALLALLAMPDPIKVDATRSAEAAVEGT
jgi:MFS family permease